MSLAVGVMIILILWSLLLLHTVAPYETPPPPVLGLPCTYWYTSYCFCFGASVEKVHGQSPLLIFFPIQFLHQPPAEVLPLSVKALEYFLVVPVIFIVVPISFFNPDFESKFFSLIQSAFSYRLRQTV